MTMASASPETEFERVPGRDRPRARLAVRLGLIGLGVAALIALSGGQAGAEEPDAPVGGLIGPTGSVHRAVDMVDSTVEAPLRTPVKTLVKTPVRTAVVAPAKAPAGAAATRERPAVETARRVVPPV